ncbi:MAG: DUF58 domain-containing protein [Flavipsychrobacter sp.]
MLNLTSKIQVADHMDWKKIKWYLKYYSQYFPFTLNTIVGFIAIYFAYRLLYQPLPDDTPTSFLPFIVLMGKLVFWFIIALVLLSLLSTTATWIYYLLLQKKEGNNLQVEFATEQRKGKRNRLFLSSTINGARRPLLGFIKGRLVYDNYEMTEKFGLLSAQKEKDRFWRKAITGRNRILLPDIKEYKVQGGFVFFEDMLRIFSLAVPQQIQNSFYQPPVLKEDDERDVYPKETETLDIRIDQLRRVDGELHNYKDFESGDDVRRIVWKVYAKNRELVVRVPERFEPFASHLYFYASFFASGKAKWLGDAYMKEMLNYYKNYIWTVYDALTEKEWALRYIPDQNFAIPEHLEEHDKNARIISNSSWQTERPLIKYFNPKKGAVLCISSFTDLEELNEILEECNAATVVYFVKTSKVFRQIVPWNLFKRLILLPPKDRLNKLRNSWIFSPMRPQVHKREKAIVELLKKSNVTYAEL